MAYLQTLNDDILNNIAGQVGAFLDGGVLRVDRANRLDIAEGFPVFMLPASEVFTESRGGKFQPTGNWQFQIHDNDAPRAIARAKILGTRAADWEVTSVFESDAPKNIDEAISIVDKLGFDGEVRVLEVPAWYISALWANDSEKGNFFIIVYAANRNDVPLLQPLQEEEFFSLLRQIPIVQGRMTSFTNIE